jgi:hypothetical protein
VSRVRLVVAVVALLAATAPAADAKPKKAPVFAGVTSISGSTTGYARVTLTKQARLGNPAYFARRGAITITGGGRFAAFALVQESANGAVLVGGHSDFTRSDTAADGEFVGDPTARTAVDGVDYVLKPGTYRLYLVPDGKPATVTLRFDGLSGRTDLRPSTARTATVQDDLRLDPTVTPGLLSFGGEHVAKGAALRFGVAAVRLEAHTETSTSFCDYEGVPSGPNPYLPGCPSPTGESSWTHILISDEFVGQGTLVSYGMSYYEPGTYGSGLAMVTGSAITAADAKQVWLNL